MRSPLALRLRPSMLPVSLIAAVHLAAAIAFFHLDAVVLLQAGVVAGLCASFSLCLRAESGKRHCSIVVRDDGSLSLVSEGRNIDAVAVSGCVDFGWAAWLRWRGPDARGALMLVRDNLLADDWRQLRIWLRHKACAATGIRGDGSDRPA